MRITPFVLLAVTLVLFSHTAFGAFVDENTIAAYHFNEGTGSWADNADGNALLDLNVSYPDGWTGLGWAGNALDCNKVAGATNELLLDADESNEGSLSFYFNRWSYFDGTIPAMEREYVIHKTTNAGTADGLIVYFSVAALEGEQGRLRTIVTDGGVANELLTTVHEWEQNVWYNYQLDWNNEGIFLYLNGDLNDSLSGEHWYEPEHDWNAFICSDAILTPARRFDGIVDEFFVSNIAREYNPFPNSLELHVIDENTSVPVSTATATFNGEEYSLDSNGYASLNFDSLSNGVYTMSITEDGNYGTRYWDVNYQGYDTNITVYLLKDANGQSINFRFFDTDTTTILPNVPIEAWYGPYLAGKATTDSSGDLSFFLHPDRNYHFVAFKGDGTTVRYNKVLLTVKLPKDEDTLVQLSPFDLSQRGIGSTNWSAQANDISFYVFSNTLEYYYFDVNAGFSYSNRSYALRIRGNPVTYSLQPYLAKRDESGDFIFSVKNSTTLASIEGVRIVIKKVIPGEGTVTIEEIETDSAGTATISLIFGIEYAVYFYYNDLLVHTATIRPTYAALFYQVLLDVTAIDIVPVEVGSLGVVFSPINRNMYIDDLNRIDLNVSVRFGGKEFSTMTITIKDSAGNVFDENSFTAPWTDGNTVSYRTSLGDFNSHYLLVVVVDMNSVDGNQYTASYTYSVWRSSQWNLFNRLLSFADQNNPADSKVVTSFIALFITILIVASLAGTSIIQAEPLFLSVVVLFLMLFFLTIGFVGIDIVVFLVVFAAVLALLTKAVIS